MWERGQKYFLWERKKKITYIYLEQCLMSPLIAIFRKETVKYMVEALSEEYFQQERKACGNKNTIQSCFETLNVPKLK